MRLPTLKSLRHRAGSLVRRVMAASPDEAALMHRVLARYTPGTMVDVGAHFGSTLIPFARDGWRVHAFEPDERNRAKLRETADAFERVSIDPRAVSSESGSRPFYRSEQSTGISGLTPFHPSHVPAGSVETVSLGAYLAEHGVGKVDFLKIDTEGHDLSVLRSVDWDQERPTAILCEFEDAKTEGLGYRWRDLADYLVERGYSVIVSEWHPVVRYGGPHDWHRFRRYPSELADPSAWGNFMAFRDGEDFARAWRLCRRYQRRHTLLHRWRGRRSA